MNRKHLTAGLLLACGTLALGAAPAAAGERLRWRLDHHVYSFPVELWVRKAAQRVLTPPKPKVDAQQLSAEAVTC